MELREKERRMKRAILDYLENRLKNENKLMGLIKLESGELKPVIGIFISDDLCVSFQGTEDYSDVIAYACIEDDYVSPRLNIDYEAETIEGQKVNLENYAPLPEGLEFEEETYSVIPGVPFEQLVTEIALDDRKPLGYIYWIYKGEVFSEPYNGVDSDETAFCTTFLSDDDDNEFELEVLEKLEEGMMQFESAYNSYINRKA